MNLQSCGSTRTHCDLCVVTISFFIVIQLSRPVARPVRKMFVTESFSSVDLKVETRFIFICVVCTFQR